MGTQFRGTDSGGFDSWVEQNINARVRVVCGELQPRMDGRFGRPIEISPEEDDRRRAVELSPEDQKTLATWATKTTLMYQFRRVPRRRVPPDRLEHLFRELEPPPHTRAWAGYAIGDISTWYMSGLFTGIREVDGQAATGELSTLALGHLVLQVLEYPEFGDTVGFHSGLGSIPLDVQAWPPSDLIRIWPPPRFLFLQRLYEYATRLGERFGHGGEAMQLPDDRTFREQIVRIPELVRDELVLRDVTFERCGIIGPAILAMSGESTEPPFVNCHWSSLAGGQQGDLESILWPMPGGGWPPTGCIVVDATSCRFIECEFYRVGLAGRPEVLSQFRQAIASD